jgi:hypothetical protein
MIIIVVRQIKMNLLIAFTGKGFSSPCERGVAEALVIFIGRTL